MQPLTCERREPLSGKASNLVVFLHGYGANGADLLGLADSLAETLPDTLFVAPNAPHKCDLNPDGLQWFSLPAFDGSSAIKAGRTLQESIYCLNDFMMQELQASELAIGDTILFGFSQGTMIALDLAPRSEHCFAGIVGFAGRLNNPAMLHREIRSRPPVVLLHDQDDPVVPFESLQEAQEALVAEDCRVYTYASSGIQHGISPIGLGIALHFMVREFERAGKRN